MKNVTVDEFLRLRPCYGEARIRTIAGARESFTALDVLAMSEIPAEDRLWAVLREEFIDAPILYPVVYVSGSSKHDWFVSRACSFLSHSSRSSSSASLLNASKIQRSVFGYLLSISCSSDFTFTRYAIPFLSLLAVSLSMSTLLSVLLCGINKSASQ